MAADPYATLGLQRTASEKEVKSAYRKLAKELHPDRNKDNPKAAERFSDVTKAYDLLSDKDKRARFDRGEIDADGNPARPTSAICSRVCSGAAALPVAVPAPAGSAASARAARRPSAAPIPATASRSRSSTPPRSSRSGSSSPTAARSTSSFLLGSRTAR